MLTAIPNRVALVTGAGSGIGRAVAIGLLAAGYSVVLAGRHQHTLDETVSLAAADERQVLALSTDVTVPSDVVRLFEAIKQRFGDDVPAGGVAGGGPRALMRAEQVSRAAPQAG
ncbi:SDR family NAD(P)-dependent oxidoreductase [Frigidibacter sp. MR17.14]|uniref:SDR family NAD(P)-dependent oxidoreductase n=1 Tax=Frigidibacter sp. MR17.14 TaxID=3126509 RepID=UPI003012AD92